jgi:hypothetical protein
MTMTNPGMAMDVARARMRELLAESDRCNTLRKKGASDVLPSPDAARSSRRTEPVTSRARELVRLASGNGYRREELVRLIETLW